MPERSVPIESPSLPSVGKDDASGATRRARRRRRRHLPAALLVIVLGPTVTPTPADDIASEERRGTATSDLLIVLGDDGRPRLVQHTLASEGALLRLTLPDTDPPAQVTFAGPERATFADAHRRTPGRVTLWSGSAVLRLDTSMPAANEATRAENIDTEAGENGDAEETAEGDSVTSLRTFTLEAPSVPDRLVVQDGTLASSRVVWLFPDALEIVSFTSVADGLGRWRRDGSLLSFEQRGGESTPLGVTWRRRASEQPSCESMPPGGDACALASASSADLDAEAAGTAETAREADRDADGVPDHRDVCLASGSGPASGRDVVDALGCIARTADARPIRVLDGIVFPVGQSYLDGRARAVLDRLADALAHTPEGTWEITAHTDGAGSRARNLRISETRAQAVRHYLMLRGIGPNRLQARGYGEARPIGDDRTEEGRRRNRRIEVQRID